MIALNAELKLSRAALCRLAQELDAWWPAVRTANDASVAALAARVGVPVAQLRRARDMAGDATRRVEQERRRAERLGIEIVTWLDDTYPPALRDLHLPPPVLYVRGGWPQGCLLGGPVLSVVGSRRASDYGREAARHLAGAVAAQGVVIVSGFAVGIDAVAHEAALDAGGQTVAVLGCGVDVPYPKPHQRLRDKLLAATDCALVSEFPLGMEPRPWSFPVRNRVIAALGRGTLVVQAAAKSGSLITAHQALELGREVLAVPGGIFDPGAVGPNALIRDGATPVQDARDILDALGLVPAGRQRELFETSEAGTSDTGTADAGTGAASNASDVSSVGSNRPMPEGLAGRLVQALPVGAELTADDLVAASGSTTDTVLGALLELELNGWVERLPGQLYRRG